LLPAHPNVPHLRTRGLPGIKWARRICFMKISAIVMAAFTAAMFALGTTFAYPQTKAPIQVENFRYVPVDNGDQSDEFDNVVDNGLWLTFKNVGQQTVKQVAFTVRDASGYALGVVDRSGTFSPGVNITRNFGMVKDKHKHGAPAKATLLSATFADGSSWNSKK
jgi:hypothetical protein